MSTLMYNEDCEINKMIFHDQLNQYRNNRCDATRIEMVRARSIFKSSVRKFKKECQKQQVSLFSHVLRKLKSIGDY